MNSMLMMLLAAATLPLASARGGLLDLHVRTIDGDSISLEQYRGSVLLIVNVASRCGNTPQYEGLEQFRRTGAGH